MSRLPEIANPQRPAYPSDLRREVGRENDSSVAIAESQSVKTTEKKGAVYGFEGGKKVKGRKRHIVVDSQGLIIGVLVTEANASERLDAVVVLHEEIDKLSRLEVVWVDQGYSGPNFKRAVQQVCGEKVRIEVIERESKEFEVLPQRFFSPNEYAVITAFPPQQQQTAFFQL